MTGPASPASDAIAFGPFRLVVGERLLTRQGVAVDMSARALDILIALLVRPNQPISKVALMAAVWPDATVGESSLRFHIAGLRKALGDGQNGARYIITLAGRGYCFVAPVSRPGALTAPVAAGPAQGNVPSQLARMVGRADGVLALSAELATSRFVTIVGAGGVGKTTVAVAVGHALIESFAGAVLFVDLGTLSDPALVAASLAAMLGLAAQPVDPAAVLIAWLRDKRLLLILDNCEHVIDAAATLAARLFAAAPGVHILATSREALRVEGEHVHRLAPLGCPPDQPGLTAAQALGYPATELFMDRAAASGARLDLDDDDAAIVAGICRKLDGVALAIELAAGRVGTYGLRQTAALLGERLSLLWMGQRTAPPRQQTLKATLDWSYDLLSPPERQMLRQLAVFVGDFTIEAALAVVASAGPGVVFGAIDSLVAKSMIAIRPTGAMMRYRLLDTTRAYALERDAGDAALAARHAAYYRRWLEETGAEWPTLSNVAERAPHLAALGNVRAALHWSFGPDGTEAVGIGLAAAAAPVFLAMSLLTECHRWSERALLALDDETRASADEIRLQAAMGVSLMFTRGNGEAARSALNRGLAIAERRGDAANQLQLLGRLHQFHQRLGDFGGALDCARRGAAIAGTMGDAAATAFAHSVLGIALQVAGELGPARTELEAALRHAPGSQRTSLILHGFDHHIFSGIYLARTLWLLGHPAQAVERARRTIGDAARMDQPVTLSVALVWAVSVFLWTGDLQLAEEHADWLIAHAGAHSLGPNLAAGRGFKGELAIRRGDAGGGVESLQRSLEELQAAHYGQLATVLTIPLVQGLMALDRSTDALLLIDATIRRGEAIGDNSYKSELLRVRGSLLLGMSRSAGDGDDAETCFAQSLDVSRRQGALAWELRTSTDLAALWAGQGRTGSARALLQPVFAHFMEGRETADLQAAERLLGELN